MSSAEPRGRVGADQPDDERPEDCRSAGRSRHRRTVVGVIAVMIGAMCGSAIFAALSPTLLTPDETADVDYAYQVWHGQLPVFDEGITFTPGAGVRVPPVQWEAHHPPLYYLLIAPAVGPLIDADRWQAAVMVARIIGILISAAVILALAWAGSLLPMRRRWAWAIAVPAVVAPISYFLRVGGAVYNDNLAALLVVLALGVGILLLRHGPSWQRLLLIGLLCGLGGLARANFVVTLLVVTGMVGVAVWLHVRAAPARRLATVALAAAIPFASALAASGWFYRRNIELTGTWTGGQTEYAVTVQHRERLSLVSVLTDEAFWNQQLRLLRQPDPTSGDWLGPRVLLVLGSLGVVACLVWAVRLVRQSRLLPLDGAESGEDGGASRPRPVVVQTAIVLALVAQVCGVLLLQIVYASAAGGVITRYLLPALLPIGALLAAGVLALGRRLAGAVLLAYLLLAWGFVGQWVWLIAQRAGVPVAEATANQVPWLAVWEVTALIPVLIIVQCVALTDWSRGDRAAQDDPAVRQPPDRPAASGPPPSAAARSVDPPRGRAAPA